MSTLRFSGSRGIRARLGDSFRVALVGMVLGIPLIGITTTDAGGKLHLQTRWEALAVAVGIVFACRFLQTFVIDRFQLRKAGKAPSLPKLREPLPITKAAGWAALGIALVLPIVFSGNRYLVDIATTVMIYVMLGWGLNVVVGLAGLLDLGYVAFYAIGAYSYALLSIGFGLSFWVCLPLAGLFAAIFGILLGYPTLRLRGDYLAIVTLGFGEIIRLVLLNWTDLTGGPNGISSIPRPTFFGLPFSKSGDTTTFAGFFGLEYSNDHRVIFLYYLIFALALLTNVLVLRLRRLPVGRAWEAMREDEIACKALGINVTNVKLSAFALGAMLGGFAGVFFSARQGFISPESFTFGESATVLAIVVLGGMGSQLGVVLAALVLVLLPELGRDFAEYRMLLFGAAMVLIMIWRPGGLMSVREPTLTLKEFLRKRESSGGAASVARTSFVESGR